MRIPVLLQVYNTKRIPYEKWFLDGLIGSLQGKRHEFNINVPFLTHENIEFLYFSGVHRAICGAVDQEFSRQMVLFWFYSGKGTPKETDLRSGMLPLLQQGGLP
ncbi:MAG: hypothetical protein IKG52_07390 [Rhodobacteraceae bacterium]|nr:hypothetical protein [Paracoccaceae bacterium]